jgi:hypothetical protein
VLESQLAYDGVTRHLTLAGGSRRDAAARAALDDVLAALKDAGEPMTGRGVEMALAGSDHRRDTVRRALALGIRTEVIATAPGPRRSTLHSLPSAPVRGSAPSVRQRSADECASAPIGGALAHTLGEESSAPTLDDDHSAAIATVVDLIPGSTVIAEETA